MAAPFLPHGTTVTFNSVDIGGLIGLGLPERSKGDVETTDNDSAFDRQFKPGLRDGGTLQLVCRLMPEDSGQDELRTNYAANAATQTCVITLPSDAAAGGTVTYTFTAYVNNISGNLPQTEDQAGEITFTLKVTDAVARAIA